MLWVLSVASAADCPDPSPLLDDAERDVLSLYLGDAQASLVQAAGAFACAPADRLVLARYWLLQGMVWFVQEDPSVDRALSAARRDAPTLYTEALGEELKARWQALDPAGGPPVALKVRGARKSDRLRVDGVSTDLREAPLGLHVIQLERDGAIVDGRVVDVSAEGLELSFDGGGAPEIAAGAGVPGWTAPWPGPPTWTSFVVRDAAGERLSFARDVIPVAMVSPEGPELWRVRRRNARLQRTAAVLGVAGGYTAYLWSWQARNGDIPDPTGAERVAGLGVVTLVGATVWEAVLVGKRRANRRGMLEAAAAVGSTP